MKSYLFLIIYTLALATMVQAANVVIPDPNLEAALLQAAGKQNPPLTDVDLPRVLKLEVPGHQIADLTGLENAIWIQELDLANNQISDITALAQLKSLRRLGLASNQIPDISPLSGLTGLTALDLAENRINSIEPLAALTNLEQLGLSDNQIRDISPVSGLTRLEELGLSSNQISDISAVSTLKALEKLGLASNQIHDITPLASLAGLAGLTLSSNQITDISPLAGLTALVGLGLGSNQISDITPLSRMTKIQGLSLPLNQISDLAPLVNNPGLGSGDELDVESNPLNKTSFTLHIPALQARNVIVTFTLLPAWDINSDGVVDISDLVAVGRAFGTAGEDLVADLNQDGMVDIVDLVIVGSHFGELTLPASASPTWPLPQDRELLQQWLTMAQSVHTDSPDFARGMAMLKQLLAQTVPVRTRLLPNYPNPFNPDTWLPYELTAQSGVVLRIYDAAGQLVRELDMGVRAAGYYNEKHRAAYWDGTNQSGERVASGTYICVLHAGDSTATRRLLLVK